MLDFIAGGVSAAVSKTVVAPLERVKMLLQIQVRIWAALAHCIACLFVGCSQGYPCRPEV